jgi:hypothetical protein
MSVLPAGRPLTQAVPDLDQLLADPRAYLEAGPLAFGPRRMYGLALLFALPGLALLLSGALAGRPDGERIALGVALLIGACVWLGWSLLLRGHEIVLHPEGVEVTYRDSTVWAPWALFNTDGQAFVADADSPLVGLTLPVNPEVLPFVELRQGRVVIGYGVQARGPQWRFPSRHEVVLPGRYEVRSADLGELLLELGRRLGRKPPAGLPPRDAYPAEEEAPGLGSSGWVIVSLTRLRFPPCCCDCGRATARGITVPVAARWDSTLGLLTNTYRCVELTVPVCADCQARLRARQARSAWRGTSAGALAGCALGWLLVPPAARLLGALGGLAAGGLAGFLAGTAAGGALPVQVRRYAPGQGTLELRFRNPDYAALLVEHLRAGTAGPVS